MIRTFARRTPCISGWIHAVSICSSRSSSTQSISTTRYHTLAPGQKSGGHSLLLVETRPRFFHHLDKNSQSARSPHSHPQSALPVRSHSTQVASMTASDTAKPLESYRLPLEIKPTHYDVTVHTDLKKLIFDGFVKIE
jgi:hypothetical protein